MQHVVWLGRKGWREWPQNWQKAKAYAEKFIGHILAKRSWSTFLNWIVLVSIIEPNGIPDIVAQSKVLSEPQVFWKFVTVKSWIPTTVLSSSLTNVWSKLLTDFDRQNKLTLQLINFQASAAFSKSLHACDNLRAEWTVSFFNTAPPWRGCWETAVSFTLSENV